MYSMLLTVLNSLKNLRQTHGMDLKFVHKERKPYMKKFINLVYIKKLTKIVQFKRFQNNNSPIQNINKYIKLVQIQKLIKIVQFNIETYISLYIIGQNSYSFFKMF